MSIVSTREPTSFDSQLWSPSQWLKPTQIQGIVFWNLKYLWVQIRVTHEVHLCSALTKPFPGLESLIND